MGKVQPKGAVFFKDAVRALPLAVESECVADLERRPSV